MVSVQDRHLVAAMAVGLGLAALGFASGCMGEPEGIRGGDHRIVSGNPTTGSPATVYLDLGFASCTGTLVSPKVVLTARHCLEDVNSVRVFFGSNANQGQGTTIDVVDFELHPQADIAILTMEENGPTAPVPVFGGAMGSLDAHLDETVHIVGFGVTSENGSDSGLKREGFTKLERLQGGIMFTGSDLSGSWTCYGDSGGPNYMTINGAEVVAGVTSFGTTICGEPEDGAVRTDTYYDWIQDYIAEHDPQQPGPDCSANGQCNAECGADQDPDCNVPDCDQDNNCNEECTAQVDPDCDSGDDSADDSSDSADDSSDSSDSTDSTDATDSTDSTDDSSDGSDSDDNSSDGNEGDDGGKVLTGGCSTSGGAPAAGWLLVLGSLLVLRRRRRL